MLELIISVFGSILGVLIGVYLGFLYAIRKRKLEIQFEAARILAGILSKYFKKIIYANKSEIKQIIEEIRKELLNKGYGIFLSKQIASLLYLIKTNCLHYNWYRVPIPERERLFFEGLYRKSIKKFQNYYRKSKGYTLNERPFSQIVQNYYNYIPLIVFAFLILEFNLYAELHTLPPSIVLITKNEEIFWLKVIEANYNQNQNCVREVNKPINDIKREITPQSHELICKNMDLD